MTRTFLSASRSPAALALSLLIAVPAAASPPTQSGWVMQRDGTNGNYESVFACPDPLTGLSHTWWDNGRADPLADPAAEWQVAEWITLVGLRGPFFGAALLMNSYGNLEMVIAQIDGQLAHSALLGVLGWSRPTALPVRAAGPPAFIQSPFGLRGNFEVIVPRAEGGLAHVWRNNDPGAETWTLAAPPISTGHWEGVGLLHDAQGALLIVGVMDGALVALSQASVGGPWSAPKVLGRGYRGRPGLLRSRYGGRGNFELIVARANGGLHHFWRNNDAPARPWSPAMPITGAGDRSFEDVALVHSSFGPLEAFARARGENVVSWFRAPHARPWSEATTPRVMRCGG